jgi:hypothetical protein
LAQQSSESEPVVVKKRRIIIIAMGRGVGAHNRVPTRGGVRRCKNDHSRGDT